MRWTECLEEGERRKKILGYMSDDIIEGKKSLIAMIKGGDGYAPDGWIKLAEQVNLRYIFFNS